MKKPEIPDKLCETKIRENIINVDLGKPLTLPLVILNKRCEFRKKWDETYNSWNKERISKERYMKIKLRDGYKERMRKYNKKYNQKPEVKERMRKYNKKYNQKPEVKERLRKYNQKPEVKEKRKKYYREHYKTQKTTK